MEFDPIVVQGMITAPITLGLVFYTLTRTDRSLLHIQLAALMSLLVVWMV